MEAILTNEELWAAVLAFLLAAGGLAVVIAKMTETPKDDEIAGKFLRMVQRLAALVGIQPKEPK